MDVSAGLELGHVFHQFIGGVGLFNRSIRYKSAMKIILGVESSGPGGSSQTSQPVPQWFAFLG